MTVFRLWLGPAADGATRITLAVDGQVVEDEPFDLAGIDAFDVFAKATPAGTEFAAAKSGLEARIGAKILDRLGGKRARLWIAVDPAVKELERLPWELVASGNVILSKRHELAFELPGGARPAAVDTWPLRVLVWVGSAPGDERVDAEAELRRMEVHLDRGDRTPVGGWVRADVQQLHLVNLAEQAFKDEILGSARKRAFLPHVLHFIGHGRGGAEPAVLVELSRDGSGPTDAWTAAKLGGLFSEYPDPADVPRLVVLNACDTARTLGASALTAAFASWGVPAVVAMVAPIGGTVAGAFSDRLYAGLQEGDDVPEAVRAARSTLGDDPAAFAVPRLYLRASHAPGIPVLAPIPAAPKAARADLAGGALKGTGWYADHHDVRWQLWHRIRSGAGVTALVGARSVGKSCAAKVVAERALLYGFVARYVDVKAWGDPPGWLAVLQAIRDVRRTPGGKIVDPWPSSGFRAFNGMLRLLAAPGAFPGAIPAVVPDEDPLAAVFDRLDARVDASGRDRLVALLRAGLDAQGQPSAPVLLVLDHLQPDADVGWLLTALAAPIANLHLVIVGEPKLFDGVGGAIARVEMPNLVGGSVATVLAARLKHRDPNVDDLELITLAAQARSNRTYASVLMDFVPEDP